MRNSKTYDTVQIGMFTCLMTLCAWMTIPMTIPFTLQTLAYFLSMFLLGGKRTAVVMAVYLGLGFIGLPVFSGFRGGISICFSPTGGFLLGMVIGSLILWLMDHLFNYSMKMRYKASLLAMGTYFALGAIWFCWITTGTVSAAGLQSAFVVSVLPFILPDVIKWIMAIAISKRVKIH